MQLVKTTREISSFTNSLGALRSSTIPLHSPSSPLYSLSARFAKKRPDPKKQKGFASGPREIALTPKKNSVEWKQMQHDAYMRKKEIR